MNLSEFGVRIAELKEAEAALLHRSFIHSKIERWKLYLENQCLILRRFAIKKNAGYFNIYLAAKIERFKA